VKILLVGLSLFMMVGCSGIPLKITTYTSPEDIKRQERLLSEQLTREETREEDELILEAFEVVDERLIIKAFEEAGADRFLIASWFNDYKSIKNRNDIDGFFEYLIEEEVKVKEITIYENWSVYTNYETKGLGPLYSQSGGRELIDRKFPQVRKNYELLKQMEGL